MMLILVIINLEKEKKEEKFSMNLFHRFFFCDCHHNLSSLPKSFSCRPLTHPHFHRLELFHSLHRNLSFFLLFFLASFVYILTIDGGENEAKPKHPIERFARPIKKKREVSSHQTRTRVEDLQIWAFYSN